MFASRMAPLVYVEYALFLGFASMASAFIPRPRGPRNPISINSTSIPTTKSSQASLSSRISSTPTYAVESSMITPYPMFSRPYCSAPATIETEYCHVSVGTLKLHYWPTGSITRNYTYPSTVVLPELGVTMTSPSIYYVINEIKATDYCGNLLGPIVSNFVTSYPLNHVSTLPPFLHSWDDSRIGGPTQLYLKDLKTDCPQTYSIPVNSHNLVADENYDPGCNPVIQYKSQLKNAVADGAWEKCGRYWGGKLGIFDPPIPVTPCGADNCANAGVSHTSTTTTQPVDLPITGIPVETPTDNPNPPPPALPPPSAHELPVKTAASSSHGTIPPPVALQTASTDLVAVTPTSSNRPGAEQPASSSPQLLGDPVFENPKPSSSPTLDEPIEDQTGQEYPAHGNTDPPNSIPSTQNNPIPTTPIPIITLPGVVTSIDSAPTTLPGSVIISAVPGKSQIVIGSQTNSQGGPAITLSNADVVSVAPSGIIISNTDNGAVVTYTIPPAKMSVSSPQSLGVIAGKTISGVAIGSSRVIAEGYTLSIGGAAATLSGNQVLRLGANGIIVQAPGGIETTLSVPTPSPETGTHLQSSAADQLRPTGSSAVVDSSGDSAIVTNSLLSMVSGSPPIPKPSESLPVASITQTGSAVPTNSSSPPVESTGLGGVIYNTFQGEESRASYFGFLGTMLSLVMSVLYALN